MPSPEDDYPFGFPNALEIDEARIAHFERFDKFIRNRLKAQDRQGQRPGGNEQTGVPL